MKKNTHNTISHQSSNHQSTLEVSHKDAVTSTESHPSLDGESTSTIKSTDRPEAHSSSLSMRKIINAFKSYILSSEDEAGIQYTPKDMDIGYLGNDREPMFVIVDSSCVSNPSSKELLIDNRFHARDPVQKRHFNKNVKPVDLPSTSTDLRNDYLPPLLTESDSTDEMQVIDINLQSDNELLVAADTECDNDSIVMSYLKNKDAFLDLEEWSEESLDVIIPSFLGSPAPSYDNTHESTASVSYRRSSFIQHQVGAHKQAIEFLHRNYDLLIAAEMGDEKMLRMLIDLGANINVIDHLGRNALHMAISSGNRNTVAMLLTAGVDPNVKDNLGMTPLSLCLMRSPDCQTAALLFDHGALIIPRVTPMDTGLFLQFVMMCIPTKEEEKILRLLVKKGALVNDPDAPGGRQALHFAAMSNNTRLISILVDIGANLFAVNHRHETPKEVAATFKCKEAYSLLDQFENLCEILNTTPRESNERDPDVLDIGVSK